MHVGRGSYDVRDKSVCKALPGDKLKILQDHFLIADQGGRILLAGVGIGEIPAVDDRDAHRRQEVMGDGHNAEMDIDTLIHNPLSGIIVRIAQLFVCVTDMCNARERFEPVGQCLAVVAVNIGADFRDGDVVFVESQRGGLHVTGLYLDEQQ